MQTPRRHKHIRVPRNPQLLHGPISRLSGHPQRLPRAQRYAQPLGRRGARVPARRRRLEPQRLVEDGVEVGEGGGGGGVVGAEEARVGEGGGAGGEEGGEVVLEGVVVVGGVGEVVEGVCEGVGGGVARKTFG